MTIPKPKKVKEEPADIGIAIEDIKSNNKVVKTELTVINKPIEETKINSKDEPKRKRIRGVLTEFGKARIARMAEMKKHHTNVKEILMCSNATPFLGKGYIGYMCCYCDSQYTDPAELKKHNRDIHGDQYDPATPNAKTRIAEYCIKLDITELRCTLCDIHLESVEKLLDHLKTEHSRTISSDINNQILPFKFNSESIQCCICPNVFEKFKCLLEHMHTHYRNFICKDCDLGFVTQGCLKRHAQKHKLGDFKCGFCSKSYDTHRKMKGHEKAVHIHRHMVSKCGYCSEKFKTHQKREEHVAKVHGVQLTQFKCRACDKTFECKRLLSTHTRRDHLMERLHKCGQCDKKFFTASQLMHHGYKHSVVKEFQCDICLKTYKSKKALTEHMKIHNNDRRFKCEHCGQTFVQKCSLKGHVKNRHGIDLYLEMAKSF